MTAQTAIRTAMAAAFVVGLFVESWWPFGIFVALGCAEFWAPGRTANRHEVAR